MKSAYLLAKNTGFFKAFSDHLKNLGYEYVDANNSVRLNPTSDPSFTFYDRVEGARFFEDHELPVAASEKGYNYGYLVECRDESYFCEIVGSAPNTIDFVVCDSDGEVYRPEQLDPRTLKL
jgi:hypothetical protein